jgi:hypothetical protein
MAGEISHPDLRTYVHMNVEHYMGACHPGRSSIGVKPATAIRPLLRYTADRQCPVQIWAPVRASTLEARFIGREKNIGDGEGDFRGFLMMTIDVLDESDN